MTVNRNDHPDKNDEINNKVNNNDPKDEPYADSTSFQGEKKARTRTQRLHENRGTVRKRVKIFDIGKLGKPKKYLDAISLFLQKILLKAGIISRLKDRAATGIAGKGSGHLDEDPMKARRGSKKSKRKYTVNFMKLFKFLMVITLIAVIVVGSAVIVIAKTAPPIEPGNIYSLLTENSVLYDDQGEIIESLQSGGLRTNVAYSDMPQDLVDAFVAIEDKTFWDHNGFNVVRIFGAIFEGVFKGESISGTSTITQQLARNLYLAETKAQRSMTRKIREAYYTLQLEKQLSKEQIVEAYMNTIYLGANANGVQAAAQAYFSKDVQELTLAECAVIASIPKSPSKYAPLKKLEAEKVEPDNENIIVKGDIYTIVFDPAFLERQKLVLSFMLDQELIEQAEYDAAIAQDIKASMKPNLDTTEELSSYFTDYIVSEVIDDLVETLDIDRDQARYMVYNNGLRIHSTINVNVQKAVEKEFSNAANFPQVTGLRKDAYNNIIDSSGIPMLYSYGNFLNDADEFVFAPDEYEMLDSGDMRIIKGRRLVFYKTEVGGNTDYSIEFKNMYKIEDGVFYSINGGVILIPAEYKEKDDDGNIIISSEFFKEKPDYLNFNSDGSITVTSGYYLLKQKVIQPQAAAVITDYKTGQIKAMMGGRSIKGDKLYNRAIKPQPPGSSIKPIAVYGPAIELGAQQKGPWTAAYVVDDSPNYYNGELWPKNWYEGYKGLVTLRKAVEQSINIVSVKTLAEIGPAASIDFLKSVGITSVVESGATNDENAAALALGGMTNGISPLEMASAYGAFPNQGVYISPVSYTTVTNKKGELVLESSQIRQKSMDPGTAFIMTDILRTTVSEGIAGAASIGSQTVAGKTGTTSNNYDAWFVGFTPYYSASVWIGNDIDIELSQGSKAASKLWSRIMASAHSGFASGSFPTASNVVSVAVDTISGKLPSDLSAMDPRGTIRNEYFVQGTQPTEIDSMHVAVNVCSDSGYLATPYCPNQILKVFVKRPAGADPSVGDYAYEPPTYYCHLHNYDAEQYPIDPTKTIDPNFIYMPPSDNPYDDEIPNNDNNNGNGNNNNNHSDDDDSGIPEWLLND